MQHENTGINSKSIVQKTFQEGKSWALYQAQIIHPWSWAWREDQHEGVKVTRGGGSVYTACCSLPVGLYTETATHAPTQTESRTRSELKWNYKRNAESTGRERLIPQEERGWWVSRQLNTFSSSTPSFSEGKPPAAIFVSREGTPGQGDWSRADHLIHNSQSELFPETVAQIEMLRMQLTR